MLNNINNSAQLRSILTNKGIKNIKSLSFLFPSSVDIIVIYTGSLAACINYNSRPLRFFAIGIPLVDSDCEWLRLVIYNEGGDGV